MAACRREGCSHDWAHVHVTEALLEAGIVDPKWYTEESRLRGRLVHKAIALGDSLNWNTLDPALVPYVEGVEAFLAEFGAVVVEHERPIAHRAKGYTGRLDAIVVERRAPADPPWIIDWKSGGLPDWVGLQTAGYRAGLIASSLETGDVGKWVRARRACVVLPGNGRYQFVPLTDRRDEEDFFHAVGVSLWKRNRRQK